VADASALIPRMTDICGAPNVITDPLELRTYECDGLTSHRATPALVVLPSSADQVADVVATELHVHEAGDDVVDLGVAVVGDPLDQGAGAIADAGDGQSDGAAHRISPSWVTGTGTGPAAARSAAMRRSSQMMSWVTLSAVCCTTERA